MSDVESFYQRLIWIDADEATVETAQQVLDQVLALTASVTSSDLVYVELFDDDSLPRYWRTYTAGASSSTRTPVSHGIVGRAIVEQRTIEVVPREPREPAVLCCPIGTRRSAGVIYAQRTTAYTPEDRRRLETVTYRLAQLAAQLLPRRKPRRLLADEIRELQNRRIQEALERNDMNIAEAARELGVGRAFVYAVLRRLQEADTQRS